MLRWRSASEAVAVDVLEDGRPVVVEPQLDVPVLAPVEPGVVGGFDVAAIDRWDRDRDPRSISLAAGGRFVNGRPGSERDIDHRANL